MTDTQKLIKALEKTNKPVTLRTSDPWGSGIQYNIIIGCDAPESIVHACFDAIEAAGMQDVGISGDMSGPNEIATHRINGGHRHY